MGHDISIRYKDHALHVFDVIEEGNYNLNKEIQNTLYITHNLSPIIYGAISYLGLDIDSFGAWLDGRQCSDAITTLDKMYKHIKKNKKKYQPMQPENGRGSYDGLVKKLKALLDACKEYPECVIYDCY